MHLARREQLSTILQVALFRPDGDATRLSTARGRVPLPTEVCRHFRDVDDIQRLAASSGLRIEVLKTPFTKRSSYFVDVVSRVRELAREPLVVFLDPDTGMAPQVPGPEHVTSDELRMTFDAMKPRDALVCYQHARRQKDWRNGESDTRAARPLREPAVRLRGLLAALRPDEVEVFESALAQGQQSETDHQKGVRLSLVSMPGNRSVPYTRSATGVRNYPQILLKTHDIQRLAASSGLRIEVLKTPFTKRSSYFVDVVSRVRESAREPLKLYFDPDTGMCCLRL